MWNGSDVVTVSSSKNRPFGKIMKGFSNEILEGVFEAVASSFKVGDAEYQVLRRDTLTESIDSLTYVYNYMSKMVEEGIKSIKTQKLLEIRKNRMEMKQGKCSEVMKWLLENGFIIYTGEEDFDCIMRIHEIHHLFWSERYKHLFIAVDNKGGKKLPAGGFKRWNAVIIPKPIYTVDQIKHLVSAII